MKGRFSQLAAAFSLALVLGCQADPLVELRLYPCEFAGIDPQAVTVEITGFDGQGTPIETFEVSFDDIAATAFADGYATVGYRKHGDVVRARFRVGWFDEAVAGPIAEADAIAVYDQLDVPDAGEVLVLGELAADCAELIADGSETGSETTETSSDTSDTSSDTTETSSDTTDTSTDTGDDGPMVGDACDSPLGFYCAPGPTPDDVGTPLLCSASSMLESTDVFASSCVGACLDGLATPIEGCGDIGDGAKCMCRSLDAPDCAGQALGCVGTDMLQLCFEGKLVVGTCVGCGTNDGGWYTCN